MTLQAGRVILKLPPGIETRMGGDGRTSLVERPRLESDLWLMAFG